MLNFKNLYSKVNKKSQALEKLITLVLIGPISICATIFLDPQYSNGGYFSTLSILGLLAIFLRGSKGFYASVAAMCIVVAIHLTFQNTYAGLGLVALVGSYILALTTSFLTVELIKEKYLDQKLKNNNRIQELTQSLSLLTNRASTDSKIHENRLHEVTKSCEELEKKLHSMSILVKSVSSELESFKEKEKAHKENVLSADKRVEILLLDLKKHKFSATSLESQLQNTRQESLKRLNNLNHLRIELHQSQTFVEGYKQKLELLNNRKISADTSCLENNNVSAAPNHLARMEQEKEIKKKEFEKVLSEYHLSGKALKAAASKQNTSSSKPISLLEGLKNEVESKKKEVNKIKYFLNQIDKEIFKEKKRMHDQFTHINRA